MTTEIYRYEGKKCTDYDQIEPGDYKTLINVNSDGDEELIVIHCRPDNKCSIAYTIHPRIILFEADPPSALYYKDETENRALLIKPGSEVDIGVRERASGSKRLVSARYRLSHR